LEAERGSFQIKAEQFDKITEIEESINQIDKTFFSYDPENKKHILNLQIRFASESYSMSDVPYATQSKLREVGRIISNFVKDAHEKNKIKYMLIIEGQASLDDYPLNYELSYSRALSLYRFWEEAQINFDPNSCEVIISGSGTGGVPRVKPDTSAENQRFLIHIIPKTGIVK